MCTHYRMFLSVISTISMISGSAFADNVFPPFNLVTTTVQVPTNDLFYARDIANEVGTNAVYTLSGMVFTNAGEGSIQTVAQGFSGTTDRSIPWKTLTELLAVYQAGADETPVRALYSTNSTSFLDSIFTNTDTRTRFQAFASSITGMTVKRAWESSGGVIAFIEIQVGGTTNRAPWFFVQQGGLYLVSAFNAAEPRDINLLILSNRSP